MRFWGLAEGKEFCKDLGPGKVLQAKSPNPLEVPGAQESLILTARAGTEVIPTELLLLGLLPSTSQEKSHHREVWETQELSTDPWLLLKDHKNITDHKMKIFGEAEV